LLQTVTQPMISKLQQMKQTDKKLECPQGNRKMLAHYLKTFLRTRSIRSWTIQRV